MSVEEVQERQDKQRKISRDLLLILLLLLLGICLMCIAGQAAIKLAPTFTMEADMGSGLDPNVDYALRSGPGYIEPILPGILDDPAWIDVFLTPGAFIPGEEDQQPPVPAFPDQPPATQEPIQNTTAVPGDNPQPTQKPTTVVEVPPTQPPNPKPTSPPKPPGPPPDVKVNLKVTITDGQSTYLPGSNVIYSIIVTNTSSNDIVGAIVQDFIPGKIDSWNWVCKAVTNASGCNGITGSSSDFTDTVNIQAGGSIQYEVTALVNSGATGALSNTVTLLIPSGYQDTDLSNNSATDTNTTAIILFSADLAIDKKNSATTYTPGNAISPYTITVTNNGPSPVIGATVTDIFDTSILTNIQWTCVTSGGAFCTGSGSGNINDSVSLLNGATITYTVTADAKSNATGSLDNVASVSVPAGYNDSNGGNNSDNDTDTAAPAADLAITKSNGVTTYVPGKAITPYTIVVTNNGPSAVTGATVTDTFSGILSNITWSCSYTGGASSSSCPGSGNINHSVNLPVGASVTYTVNANTASTATANLYNSASVSVPAGVASLVPGNNSDSDTDTPIFTTDLSISKVDNVDNYASGVPSLIIYTIDVSNLGPNDVTGAIVEDYFPREIESASWTCSTTGSATCTANGSGDINDTVDIPAGATITYEVDATISAKAFKNIVNTATVSAPAGVDSNPANDSDTETTVPLLPSCVFSGPSGPVTIPNGGCLFDRTAPGPTGNIYTITNNDANYNVSFIWYGLGENQTTGACGTNTVSLGPRSTLSNIAVSKLFGSTTIAIDNSSGSSVDIYVTESTWSSGGCTNP